MACETKPTLERRFEVMEAPKEASTDYVWARCTHDCGIETDSFGYVDSLEKAWKAESAWCDRCADPTPEQDRLNARLMAAGMKSNPARAFPGTKYANHEMVAAEMNRALDCIAAGDFEDVDDGE